MHHARLCPESSAPPGRLGAVESAGLRTPLRLCGVGAAQSDSTRIFADPVRRPTRPLPAGRVIKRLGELGGGRIFLSLGLGAGLGSESRASARHAGDPGSIPGSGRSPGEGNGNPLQYSCLENPMEGRAWWAPVNGGRKEADGTERPHFLSFFLTWGTGANWAPAVADWMRTGVSLPARFGEGHIRLSRQPGLLPALQPRRATCGGRGRRLELNPHPKRPPPQFPPQSPLLAGLK